MVFLWFSQHFQTNPHHFAPSHPIPLRPDAAAADRGVHLQLAGGITQEPNA